MKKSLIVTTLISLLVNIGGMGLAPMSVAAAPAMEPTLPSSVTIGTNKEPISIRRPASPAFPVEASIVVNKGVGEDEPLVGGQISYNINVENQGSVYDDDRGFNLTISDTLPAGLVFASSSLAPSVVTENPDGSTTLQWINIKNLEAAEDFQLTIRADIEPTIAVGVLFTNTVYAEVNTAPDNSGTWITDTASAPATAQAIDIEKTAIQSTGVSQATGAGEYDDQPGEGRGPGPDWPYEYRITVQNNNITGTTNVVVTDTLPPGAAYLGDAFLDGSPVVPTLDLLGDGSLNLIFDMGDLTTAHYATPKVITFEVGIPYRFRTSSDTAAESGPYAGPMSGAIIPDDTAITDTYEATGLYNGTDPTADGTESTPQDDAPVEVNAAYLTVEKGVIPGTVRHGDTVTYTINYYVSEYYTFTNVTLTDVLTDGLTYRGKVSGPGLAPIFSTDTPITGATTITFTVPAANTEPGDWGTIVFTATVDAEYERFNLTPLPPIVAGDSLGNRVTVSGHYTDTRDTGRNGESTDADSASVSLMFPSLRKLVRDPDTGIFSTGPVTATIGDQFAFSLTFTVPHHITVRNIVVDDFLPRGMSYVLGTASYSVVDTSVFTDSPNIYTTVSLTDCIADPTPTDPSTDTLNGLEDLEWNLCSISDTVDVVWQALVTATVKDVPQVADGILVANFGNASGLNTFGESYSLRDSNEVNYVEPRLVITKTAEPYSNLKAGDEVTYTILVKNHGHSPAYNVGLTDTIPTYISVTIPAPGSGTPHALTCAIASGEPDLGQGGILTWTEIISIPVGGTQTYTYTAVISKGVGANAELTNIATVEYNTQPDDSGRQTPGTDDPADDNTDDATVYIRKLAVNKSITPTTMTIGDIFTQTMVVTVPAGTRVYTRTSPPYVVVRDTQSTNGIQFLTPTVTLTDSGSGPALPASFATPSTTLVNTGGGAYVDFNLNEIDNSENVTYVFTITVQALVTGWNDSGNSWVFNVPPTHHTTRDSFYVLFNDGLQDRTSDSASATANIEQPLLDLEKTVTPATADAGDTVTYTLVVTNVGSSIAYDVVMTDAIPVNIKVLATGGSGSPVNSEFTADAGAQIGTGGFIIWTTVPSIAVGATQKYTYTATVSGTVPIGSDLVNTADVDWSTQEGDTDDERVFDDSSQETYAEDTDSATLNIDLPLLDKTIFATSLNATGSDQHTSGVEDLAIGEIVTFHIVITLPEGTTPAVLTDTMPHTNGVLGVLSSKVIAFGGNISATGANPGVSGAHTDRYRGDGINDTVEFNFGTVTNVFDNLVNRNDCITVEVVARVEHVPENADGDLLTSPAALNYDTGTLADAVDVEIVEPDVGIDKSVASSTGSTSGLDGTALLTYTIRLTNTGTSPAYDVVITDAIPSGISVTALYGGDWRSAPVQGPGILTWTVSVMSRTLPGANNPLVLTYTARISGAVASGNHIYETIYLKNTVSAIYSSLPGDLPPDQERDYGPVTDEVSVSTAKADTDKDVSPFSDDTNNLRIGDIVTYTIVNEVPPGLIIPWPYQYDALPDTNVGGVRYVTGTFAVTTNLPFAGSSLTDTLTSPFASATDAGDRGVDGLSATVNPNVGPFVSQIDRQAIEWWLQTLNNARHNTTGLVTITFQAQIVGVNLDGTTEVWSDQSDSERLYNFEQLNWNAEDVGVYTTTTTVHDDTSSCYSYVSQPNLAIDKDSNPAPRSYIGKGDLITYTLTITNDGHAPAYDIVVSDTLPPPDLTTYITSTIGSATPSTIAFDYEPPVGSTDVITWRVNELWGSDLGGGTAVITVVVRVTDTIGADVEVLNTVEIPYYDSQPGDGPGPHTPDERVYTDGSDSVWLRTVRPYGKKFDVITTTIGDEVIFRVEGPWITATIYNVVATDTVDSRLLVNDCLAIGDGLTPIECGRVGQMVTGTWGSIPPFSGENSTLFITTTLQDQISATAGTLVTNTANYRWTDNSDPHSQEYLFSINVVTVTVAEPDITVDKSVQIPPLHDPVVGANDIVTYTIVLTNEGKNPPWAAYDIRITDTLQTGLTFVETKQFTVSDPTTATLGGDYPAWTVSQLNVGGRAYITFTAQVSYAIGAGLTLTNSVKEGRYDTQPGDAPVERCYSITPTTVSVETGYPDLDLVKTTEPITAIAGTQLTYTLTVTNVGIVSATEAFITDVIPVNTTFVTASLPHAGPLPDTGAGSVITWPLGTLDIGVPRAVTMVVQVPSSVYSGTIITDTARVTCAEGISDTDTITTLVNTRADLAVFKSDDPDPVPSGGILAYTLNYVNYGPSYARNVYITDTLPLSVTYGGVVSVTPPLFGPTETIGPPFQLTWYTPTLPDGASGAIVLTVTVLVTTTDPFTNTVTITSTTPDPITGNNTAVELTAKPAPIGGVTLYGSFDAMLLQVGLAALVSLFLTGGVLVVRRRRVH